MKKIHAKAATYCEHCGHRHANDSCPSPAEITQRAEAVRAKWTESEAERREPGKPLPVELPEWGRAARVVRTEIGRR